MPILPLPGRGRNEELVTQYLVIGVPAFNHRRTESRQTPRSLSLFRKQLFHDNVISVEIKVFGDASVQLKVLGYDMELAESRWDAVASDLRTVGWPKDLVET